MNGKIQYGPARTLTFTETRRRPRLADPARFPAAPHTSRTVILLLAASLVAAGLLAAVPRELPGLAIATLVGGAWLALVLVITLPSGSEVAGAELSRRLGRFRHAVNSIGDHPTRADFEHVLALAREMGLRENEIGDELEQVRAGLKAIELREQLAEGELPIVPGVDSLPPDDYCHFLCPVRFGRRRSDQFGHLLLTSGWLRFRGALDLSVAWSEVSTVQRAGREIIVTLQESTRALRLACHTFDEATRGSVIAEYLAQAAHREEPQRDGTLYQASV